MFVTPTYSPSTGVLDVAGVGLSVLCLVHCAALPLAAALLPALAVWGEAEWVHWAFLALAASVSAMVLLRPTCFSYARGLIGLAGVGLALMLFGALEWPDHGWEEPLTIVGGLLVAAAHLLNWRRGAAR